VLGLGGALGALKHSHGQPFKGHGYTIEIAGKLEIEFEQARQWTPPTVRLEGDDKAITEAIRALHDTISTQGARQGLAPLVDLVAPGSASPARAAKIKNSSEPLLRMAARSLDTLVRAWRAGKVDSAREAALKLLGLGPGLTPSGDDLLAGLLAVCKWSRRRLEEDADANRTLALCEAVVEAVVAGAPARTTRLSARLLNYAADGILYDPAMSRAASLFAGRSADVEPAALKLFGLGHTSGTDMAVGILLGAALNFE